MNSSLQKHIEKLIGTIHETTILDEQGCTSIVKKLLTEKGTFILKSSFKDKYREWLKTEAKVLRTSRLTDVPQFYGFIEESDGSHLIMSYEKGMTLSAALKQTMSEGDKKRLIRSFGRFVHELHELEVDKMPESDWLDEQLVRAQSYVDMGEADGNQLLLERLKSHKPNPVKQTFIHGDCTTDNVLVTDGEVSLFIDVAGMTVGDPRYDVSLAIRKFIDHEDLLQAFYEGYTRYRVSREEYLYFNEGLYEFF